MRSRTEAPVRNNRTQKRAKKRTKKDAAKMLGLRCMAIVMTISMVLSGDGVAYGTRAFAQSLYESTDGYTEVYTGDSSNSEQTEVSNVVETVTPPGDSASDAQVPSNDEPQDDAPEAADQEPASAGPELPAHVALVGNLPVYLSFTMDGKESAPCNVTLKLQRRTQTWDPEANAWSPIDEAGVNAGWEDVVEEATGLPVMVHLSADRVSRGILASHADDDPNNDGAAYTFTNQTIQTVTEDGAYDARFEYRAVASSVDGAPKNTVGYNTHLSSVDEAARTQTYAVKAKRTIGKKADYTVTVSTEASLHAEGDAPDSDGVVIVQNVISIDGTKVEPATKTDKADSDKDVAKSAD
ncbi:MAG: hypothetical protein U0J70_05225, partial [Atopobiaceae bacterium]|nr:hypothetical protein [Atopobiaceae bacterium]